MIFIINYNIKNLHQTDKSTLLMSHNKSYGTDLGSWSRFEAFLMVLLLIECCCFWIHQICWLVVIYCIGPGILYCFDSELNDWQLSLAETLETNNVNDGRSTVAHWNVFCFSPGGPGFNYGKGRFFRIKMKNVTFEYNCMKLSKIAF